MLLTIILLSLGLCITDAEQDAEGLKKLGGVQIEGFGDKDAGRERKVGGNGNEADG